MKVNRVDCQDFCTGAEKSFYGFGAGRSDVVKYLLCKQIEKSQLNEIWKSTNLENARNKRIQSSCVRTKPRINKWKNLMKSIQRQMC